MFNLRSKFHFNPFQPSATFDIETSDLICSANQMTGFYIKCSTRLKWVNNIFESCGKFFVRYYLIRISAIKITFPWISKRNNNNNNNNNSNNNNNNNNHNNNNYKISTKRNYKKPLTIFLKKPHQRCLAVS